MKLESAAKLTKSCAKLSKYVSIRREKSKKMKKDQGKTENDDESD